MNPASKKIIYAIMMLGLIFCVLPWILLTGNYSSGLLYTVPFGIGLVFALLASVSKRRTTSQLFSWSLIPLGLLLLASILSGEGAICLIIMGLVLLIPFYIGVAVGSMIQNNIWVKNGITILTLGIILSAASTAPRYNQEKAIQDALEIRMSDEQLWSRLTDTLSFGKSDDFFFRNGVSYPESMLIKEEDNRRFLVCRYSNGVIEAPIIGWEPNRSLAFRFHDSLVSMRETNLYSTSHTMHIRNHFEIRYGRFEIRPIDRSRCRLILTTSYRHKFEPEFYTDFWVRYFVHNLHNHILSAVSSLADQ